MIFLQSDFEMKFLRRVKVWIENFTTRQILNWKIYDGSDFEEK